MNEAVIVSAVRTPIGRYMGGLKEAQSYDERSGRSHQKACAVIAGQVLADLKRMGLESEDHEKVNVNGSGISLGHPIACTGTPVLVALLMR
jgi:acetyl-CoA acetyltransferase